MDVTVKVSGLRELNEALKSLPREISEKLLDQAVGAGARVVREETKQRAPIAVNAHFRARGLKVPPGTLRRAIYAMRAKDLSSFTSKTWLVGVRRGKGQRKAGRDAFYWWWVENGHKIVPRRPRFVSLRQHRKNVGSSKGRVPAYPFLRPAFEMKKMAAVEAIRDSLDRGIQRTAQRLAKIPGR